MPDVFSGEVLVGQMAMKPFSSQTVRSTLRSLTEKRVLEDLSWGFQCPYKAGPGRGLTVVTVQPDGTLIDSATFDTMKAGSDALAVHINNIDDGTMVLIGALGEASINLTDTAKTAIKTCGATMIDGKALSNALR
ncbi:Fam3b [Symbiodinium natans]|uniref:Fam3b protein n=1 Tax=Symbiodinium natans TaxID=878477 RepID=A0A812UX85_9DINO|nr:Fam3b [Symbiodinium natans]